MAVPDNFAVFILTHGRPDRVYTYKSLLKHGYTGPIYFIVDDEDKTLDAYLNKFGDKVIIFSKREVEQTFDIGDNFDGRQSVIYARNACFDIARELGFEYFMELDDDYVEFYYKTDDKFRYVSVKPIKRLDDIICALLEFYQSIPAKSIAMAQGGDFIAGKDSAIVHSINIRRKCMNSFICSVNRPFKFMGRLNDDVNTYVWHQIVGNIFLTCPLVAIGQIETQQNAGGLTEAYLNFGTYVKSFYTVMYSPSSVRVSALRTRHPRLHHQIDWDTTVPVIISEKYKKTRTIVTELCQASDIVPNG